MKVISFRKSKENPFFQINKNSIVYDITNGYGHFPLVTLRSNNHQWIKDITSWIKFYITDKGLDRVGIICHQEYENCFKNEIPQASVLHHFYQRGETIDSDMLFVVGTPFRPFPVDIIDYILLFNEFPSTIEVKEGKRFQGYKHTMLNEVFEANVIDEIYQELHRTRMLLYDRKVYAFCDVPKIIDKEVTVQKSDFKSARFFAFRKVLEIIQENEPIGRTILRNKVKNLKPFLNNPFNEVIEELIKKTTIIEIPQRTGTKPKKLYKLTEYGRDYLEAINRDINL
jgi:hypothetical protein